MTPLPTPDGIDAALGGAVLTHVPTRHTDGSDAVARALPRAYPARGWTVQP